MGIPPRPLRLRPQQPLFPFDFSLFHHILPQPVSASTSTASFRKHRRLFILTILLLLGGLIWWIRQSPSEMERYRAQLIAQGEILDLEQLAPKRAVNPPEVGAAWQNLATNDFVYWTGSLGNIALADWKPGTNSLLRLTTFHPTSPASLTNRLHFWRDINSLVETNRAALELLRDALQTPVKDPGRDYLQFLDYTAGPVLRLRSYAQFCRISAVADIHAHAVDESYATMTSLMNLTEYRSEEWIIVAQMIRIALVKMAHEPTWYALESHTWDESKLLQLQTRWENVSLVTNTYQALLFERASGNAVFTHTHIDRERVQTQFVNHPFLPSPPGGRELFWQWWRLSSDLSDDQLFYLKNQQAKLTIWREHIRNPSWARAINEFAALEVAKQQALTNSVLPNKYLLTEHLDFDHSRIATTLITTETLRVQTITAIALERHRLKHGHYPDTLAKLIPDYLTKLPQDPMDGRAMRYRLNPDRTFTLWSVGLDGTDNGGDPTMPDPQKQNFPQDARDLVWPRLDPIDLPP